MPELTPEYRAHLRQLAERLGDTTTLQLLDALEATERDLDAHITSGIAAAETIARVQSLVDGGPLCAPCDHDVRDALRGGNA